MLSHNLKKILYIFCISIVCLFFSISSLAQQEDWPKNLSIGSASIGGGFYMMASALSKVINDKIPGVNSTVEITGAGEANVTLLKAKEIDIGCSNSVATWESFNMKGWAEGNPEKVNKDIRAVFNGYPAQYIFTTLKKYGINNLSDFEGKVFSVLTKGSGTNLMAKRCFEVLGINIKAVYLSPSDSAASLKDGVISGFALGWPNPTQTLLEAEHEVVIVTPNDEEIKKILAVWPQYSIIDIPGGVSKVVPEPRTTIGCFGGIACQKDLPTDLVYTIISAVNDNLDIVRSIWPPFADSIMKIEDLLKYSPVPLHTGLLKYVREQGFSVPEELIPPEAK